LTLVSAPAGFGKTTMVSEWVRNYQMPITWLSLDRADDDPGQFFAYFIAALQKVNENIGREIENTLHAGQLPSSPVIATCLVNDILSAGAQFILVLDDFQVIQDRAIMEVLEMVLANPPGQLHLVLITREDPLLPLSRLRANNQMVEIRAEDLRFSDLEVDLFLNEVMGLDLSQAEIEAMENRTEGWAAGLQLAAIAMHNREDLSSFISHFSGSYRYILGYLTEEVLSRQPESIQTFLLQTSILNNLCGELCNAVTGRSDSRSLLEGCFHANLFLIPLDAEGRWYRYHHLFQDLLQNQQSHFPKENILELHRRASRWYAEAGMVSDSIDHALRAQDYARAVQLLEDHARGMVMQGYMKTVEGWMQAVPSEWQSHNPRTTLAFAWMHLLRGNYKKVMPYLEQAELAIREIDPSNDASKSLRAELLSLQSILLNVQGEPGQSIELANQALQLAGPENDYAISLAYSALGGGYRLAGNYSSSVEAYQLAIQNSRAGGHHTPEMLAVGGLMLMAIQHGQLHFAHETGNQTIERLEREGSQNSPMAGAVYASLGVICFEWNLLEKAYSCFLRSIKLSSSSGHNVGVVYAKTYLARLLQAQGDSQAAARTIQEVLELLPLGLPSWIKPEVALLLVRYYLDQGNLASAKAVTKLPSISIPEEPILSDPSDLPAAFNYQDGLITILAIRLVLNQQNEGENPEALKPAIDLAGCLVSRSLSNQINSIALQALLLRAQLLSVQGNIDACLADLRQAVELAEPEGYTRVFLDEGPAIAALLRRLLKSDSRRNDRQVDFIRQLLAVSGTSASTSNPGVPLIKRIPIGLHESQIEPLTEREMDVIRLMADGHKYQEIAARLFITLNTVRFYVKQIYSKLSVNNRTQAIEAAHKLNLL
jgi:LuxR family maltose regulon positive regulatory protein